MRRSIRIALAASAAVAVAGGGAAAYAATVTASDIPNVTEYHCTMPDRTDRYVYTNETNFLAFLNSHGGTCPSGGTAYAVGSGSSSPAPSPSATTPAPSPSPTTPSPSPTPTDTTAGYTCTTTVLPQGYCPPSVANGIGYVDDPGVQDFKSNWNQPSPWVSQNEWSGQSGVTQTLSANSFGDWQVVVNAPQSVDSGNAVLTYPNAGINLNDKPLTGWGDITSTFADSIPSSAGTDGHQGYDNWFNSWGDEEMIQTQWAPDDPACSYVAVQQFAEPGTGTMQTWGLCSYGGPGGEKIWDLAPAGTQVGGSARLDEPSGAVDITAMTDYLVNNGYMLTSSPSATTLTSLSAGFEVSHTPGDTTWKYTDLTFSSTAQP